MDTNTQDRLIGEAHAILATGAVDDDVFSQSGLLSACRTQATCWQGELTQADANGNENETHQNDTTCDGDGNVYVCYLVMSWADGESYWKRVPAQHSKCAKHTLHQVHLASTVSGWPASMHDLQTSQDAAPL